jgi:hypothetical protein
MLIGFLLICYGVVERKSHGRFATIFIIAIGLLLLLYGLGGFFPS